MDGGYCYALKSIENGFALIEFGVTMLFTGRSLTSTCPLLGVRFPPMFVLLAFDTEFLPFGCYPNSFFVALSLASCIFLAYKIISMSVMPKCTELS